MKYHHIVPDTIRKAMLGNTDMVRQFVEMYIEQCPLDFQKLEKSIQKGHRQDIADAAHHIKPTMEYVGAIALRIDFQELESLARQEEDQTVLTEKFEALQTKFHELMQELEVFREGL